MIDTAKLAQELQDQVLTAVHRGQQQFRKGQDQVRKGQDQMRKGRDAMANAFRAGNELTKAIRPNIPALPNTKLRLPALPDAASRLPSLGTLANPAKLREHVNEFAGHVAATQRNVADKAMQAAGPLVAEGVARFGKVVGSLAADRGNGQHDSLASAAADESAERVIEHTAKQPRTTKAASAKSKAAGTAKSRSAKK